jgi:hypothetical protein
LGRYATQLHLIMKKIQELHNISLIILFSLFLFGQTQAQGTWTALKNPAPMTGGGGAVLLTDGRVLCKGYINGIGFPSGPDNSWMMLTPDVHGSYVNGTWAVLPPGHDTRSVYSSQVLPTGNVYVGGGEEGSGGYTAELFNTVTNTWSYIPNVPGYRILDANSELLYDGTIIQGCGSGITGTLIYAAAEGKLNAGPAVIGSQFEATWIKLPDSSILYAEPATTSSERYIPQIHTWVTDAHVPVQLYSHGSDETGPAMMLPNGKAIFIGDMGYTAIYTPSGDTNPGTWATGPNEPISASHVQLGSWDGPCAAMVNGKVLYALSPLPFNSVPTYFYEYDYISNTFNRVGAPCGLGDSVETLTNRMTMLDLPDGTVLLAIIDSNKFYIYTPSGASIPEGKPTIDGLFSDSCNRYMITGKLFNGISEGADFGDDWQMYTNYPLVRLTSGTNVYYAKTFNWNRLGALQTDSAEDTAYFTLPSLPGGTYSLVVTANGFASSPVSLTTFGVGVTATNITACHGTGSATASASYGTKPYTYLWSPGGGTDSIASGLTAGTYTIMVTEVGGCSASATATIKDPVINISVTGTFKPCLRGIATAKASGGYPPYTYTWSNGATNDSINGLTGGKYKVTVSDSCGYIGIDSVTIKKIDSILSVRIATANDIVCYGDSTGKVTAKATGGTRLYTYSWSNGATSSKLSALKAGSYTLIVSDSCGATATTSVTITQPTALIAKLDSVNVTNIVSCNGKAKAIVSGGTPPYTYKWLPGGQTIDSIYNQCQGAYCCTITDNSGCSKSICIYINTETGIENISADGGRVSVYPNPNNGVLTIELANNQELIADCHAEIYNMLGEQVYIGKLNAKSTQVDLSANSAGIYLYRVITDSGDLVGEGKFIIQK